MIETLYILIIASISCGLIGSFLVLRRLSMVSDAISHSVLLGIVLAFFIAKDINSPLLIVGATIFGILTVFCIETISNTGLVKNDDAVGIVFPLFFAIAVILITKFARNLHLDTDVVLMGEVILAPLNRIDLFGISLPKALVNGSFMLIINLLFIILFFKELKITTFDENYSKITGISTTLIFYALMSLSSLTAVVSFDAVGAILVVSFLITPGACSYLITKDLKHMLISTIIISAINAIIGYYLAIYLNVSLSGMTAFVGFLVFLVIVLFNRNGVITQYFIKLKNKKMLSTYPILIHLGNHTGQDDQNRELGIDSIHKHLNWTKDMTRKKVAYLINKNLIQSDKTNSYYEFTQKGKQLYEELKREYGV